MRGQASAKVVGVVVCSRSPGASLNVCTCIDTIESLVIAMSNIAGQTCCGRTFKSDRARMQHVQDSQQHRGQSASDERTFPLRQHVGDATAALNIVQPTNVACSCGKLVSKKGVHDHLRDSPRHSGDGVGGSRGVPEDGRVHPFIHSNPSPKFLQLGHDDTVLRPGDEEGLRHRPVPFVQEGARVKLGRADRRRRAQSSSEDLFSDVDHSLCDKDCGWCGHCANNVSW